MTVFVGQKRALLGARPANLPAGQSFGTDGSFFWRNGPSSVAQMIAEDRAGTALALMADGSYQSFGANTPILRPVLGLDGWGEITNTIIRSNNFIDPAWVYLNLTPSSSAVIAPDGGNATRLAVTAGNNRTAVASSSGASVIGVTYTHYFHFRAATLEFAQSLVANFSTGDVPYANFNVATGEIGTVQNSTTKLIPIGNDWYIAAMTWTAAATNQGGGLALIKALTDARSPTLNWTGTENLDVFGAQQTVGDVIYPYVPTTTAAVTRPASNLTIVDPASLGITKPRFVADVNIDRLSASAARTLYAAGVDADNLVRVFLDTDNKIKARRRASGSDVWTLQSGVIGATGVRRVEVNFSPGANSLFVEGVDDDSNTDATALPDLTTWRLLNGLDGATPWAGNVPLVSLGQAA